MIESALDPEFSLKMKEVNKIYANFPAILEKTEQDGSLARIHDTASTIFLSEMNFAIQGNLSRTQATQQRQKAERAQGSPGNEPVHLQGEPEDDLHERARPNLEH